MKRAVILGSFAAALLSAPAARADLLYLKNGTSLEGKVTEQGDRIRIEVEYGTIEFARSQVERIEPKTAPADEFAERFASMKADDAEGYYRLGLFAEEKEMEPKARAAFDAAIRANPDHAGARARLGHEKVDGKWMTRDEAMRARGLVRFEGEWVTKEEREDRVAALDRRLKEAQAEADRLRRRLKEAEATIGAMDQDLRAMSAELERLRERLRRPAVVVVGGACSYGVVHGPGFFCNKPLCHAPPPPPHLPHPHVHAEGTPEAAPPPEGAPAPAPPAAP